MGGGASSKAGASGRYEASEANAQGLTVLEENRPVPKAVDAVPRAMPIPRAVDAAPMPEMQDMVTPQAVRVRAATMASPARSSARTPATSQSDMGSTMDGISVPAHWKSQIQVPQAKQINSTPITPDRAASQHAALSAVHAVVQPQPRPLLERGHPRGQNGKERFGATVSPGRKRFPTFEVDVTSKKAMLHWVRMARKRVLDIAAMKQRVNSSRVAATAPSAKAPAVAPAAKRKKVAARVDRLVEMFIDNQEELERLCLKDPSQLLTAQIDLLTRRINSLANAAGDVGKAGLAAPESLDRKPRPPNDPNLTLPELEKPQSKRRGDKGPKEVAPVAQQEAPRQRAEGVLLSWEDAFDRAMKTREEWKKNRDKAVKAYRTPLRAEPMSKSKKDDGVDMLIVAQLRAQREELAKVMLAFEARVRKTDDQAAVDLAESMAEARRQAYARRDAEVRERHRKVDEERKRMEARRRQLEDEERAKQAELDRAKREEQRKDEAWRKKLREQEALSWKKREAEMKRKEEEMAKAAAVRRAAEEAARRAAEERVREEEAIRAAKQRNRFQDALDLLEGACEDAELEETLAVDAGEEEPQGKDWMVRALEALEGVDEEDVYSDSWGEAAVVTEQADVELAHLSEAIAKKINKLHRLEPRGSTDSITGSPL